MSVPSWLHIAFVSRLPFYVNNCQFLRGTLSVVFTRLSEFCTLLVHCFIVRCLRLVRPVYYLFNHTTHVHSHFILLTNSFTNRQHSVDTWFQTRKPKTNADGMVMYFHNFSQNIFEHVQHPCNLILHILAYARKVDTERVKTNTSV